MPVPSPTCTSSVTANMRGETPEAVSTLLLQDDGLQGLQVRAALVL